MVKGKGGGLIKPGTVVAINYRMNRIAVVDEYNEFTVMELLDDDAEVGDVLSGDLHSLGETTLYNTTKKSSIKAFIEDHSCSEKNVIKLLELRRDNKKEWETL